MGGGVWIEGSPFLDARGSQAPGVGRLTGRVRSSLCRRNSAGGRQQQKQKFEERNQFLQIHELSRGDNAAINFPFYFKTFTRVRAVSLTRLRTRWANMNAAIRPLTFGDLMRSTRSLCKAFHCTE